MGRSEEKEDDSSFSAHERGERKAAVSEEPFNWKTKEKHYIIVVADACCAHDRKVVSPPSFMSFTFGYHHPYSEQLTLSPRIKSEHARDVCQITRESWEKTVNFGKLRFIGAAFTSFWFWLQISFAVYTLIQFYFLSVYGLLTIIPLPLVIILYALITEEMRIRKSVHGLDRKFAEYSSELTLEYLKQMEKG